MSNFKGWTTERLEAAERAKLSARIDKQAKPNKYRNQKVQVDGIMFDSKAEAKHYGLLIMAREAGHLKFERQVPFVFEVTYRANEREVKKKMRYVADFVVKWKGGRVEVQDVKGVRTKEYKQKKKLMSALYGIEITEIK